LLDNQTFGKETITWGVFTAYNIFRIGGNLTCCGSFFPV